MLWPAIFFLMHQEWWQNGSRNLEYRNNNNLLMRFIIIEPCENIYKNNAIAQKQCIFHYYSHSRISIVECRASVRVVAFCIPDACACIPVIETSLSFICPPSVTHTLGRLRFAIWLCCWQFSSSTAFAISDLCHYFSVCVDRCRFTLHNPKRRYQPT